MNVDKMNYRLGSLDPNWAIFLKSGQDFSRSGPKKIFMMFPIGKLDSLVARIQLI